MNELSNILRFNKRTHRPCFYLGLVLSLGIGLGHLRFIEWYEWSILSGVLLILSLLRTQLALMILHLAVLSLGALYYQSIYLFPSHHVALLSYQDCKETMAVQGIIDSDVQNKATAWGTKQTFELQLSQIKIKGSWRATKGKILVDDYTRHHLDYGDQVVLGGHLHKAFNDRSKKFSYQQYLENHGLFFILTVGQKNTVQKISGGHGYWWMEQSLKIKHKLMRVLATYLEPRETGMIQAMIIGERSSLPKDIYTVFSQTGTAHVLAISGMNMAIITAIVLFLLKVLRVPRIYQFILTILFLLAYAFVSGWSASVVRSVFMAAVILASFCLEYETDTMNSLGFAAIVLLALNPLNLFDWGFQLSFLSVGMIIYLYPLIQPLCTNYLTQALGISLLAWVGVSGLSAYYFDIVSPIGILANIPIVPLADMVVALGLGLGCFGLFCQPLAIAFAGVLKATFNLMLIVASWFAQIPGAYFYIHSMQLWQVFLYYFVLIIVYLVITILPLKQKDNP